MLLSVSTGSLFPLPLAAIFRQCAEAGYDGLEISATGLRGARDGPRVARLAQRYHLPVLTVHQTLIVRPRGVWCEWILEATELALRSEARYVVIHGPNTHTWECPAAERWLLTLEMSQHRLIGSGIRLALENSTRHAASDAHKVLAELPDLVAFAAQHDLDVTYDTCHAAAAGVDVLDGWQQVAERVVNIHFSDLVPTKAPVRTPIWRSLVSDHQLPGDGILPLQALHHTLAAGAYPGILTFEVSPLALPTLCPLRLQGTLRSLAQFGK